MDTNYIRIFKDLFFNIDENESVKSTIEKVNYLLSSIIIKYGEIENEIAYGISRQDDFIDIVMCLFIRKIMEQLDAINVLFSVSSFNQAQILLRSLIENTVSLEFVLKEETEKRAAAYFLEHHYQEIELGKTYFNKNSKFGKLMIQHKGTEQFNHDYGLFKKKEEAFKRIISSKEIFQIVDKAREEKIQQKENLNRKQHKPWKKVHIQWYEVCSDVSNFYELMKETGYELYYQGIYGGLSYETHALNSTMDLTVNENGLNLKRIRNPVGGSSSFDLTCSFSISALTKLYKYLKDGIEEIREFEKFYIDFQEKRKIVNNNLDMIINS